MSETEKPGEIEPEVEKAEQDPEVEEDDDSEETIDEAEKAEQERKLKELEKEEEAKLRSKYGGLRGPGSSDFLQKRLSKGNKYFDSGDYNMAKAKTGATNKPSVVSGPTAKTILPGPTGDAIPTPETVPHKKVGLLQSKLASMS
jgi:hypothetical protein